MIKKYSLVFIIFLCFVVSGFGQTKIAELTFETAGGYTTSIPEFTDNGTDYFTRTDGSNLGGAVSLSNIQGSYYFAAQDVDAEGDSSMQSLYFSGINISGYTSLEIRIHIAEDDDGTNQDWDSADYFHVSSIIDGNAATFENLIWVNASSGTNTEPRIDTNFNGVGNGTAITDSFSQFTQTITGTGNSIEITFDFNLDSGDEDIAIDNIEIWGISGTPTCNITNSGLANILCNDNTTTTDATDDFITFDLDPTGSILGTNYSVSVSSGSITPATGTYGSATSFTLQNGSAGAGDVNITITDDTDGSCTFIETITDPGNCSGGGGGNCASESFINIPTNSSGSYLSRNWIGDDSINWTATDARTDQGLNGNDAIMLRNGSLTNDSSFLGGCGIITFDYARIYSGNSTLQVFVNGTQYGGDINVSLTTSTTISITAYETGNIDVELRNSGNRTLINNLSWTCHSCSAPSDSPLFTATNGCGSIDLSWDAPACADEVLIVARNGSAVTAVPTGDGSAYTDNTVFGSGTALLAGQFDVYEGTDTSASITGITNGNTYHFTVFSRVGSTWTTGISASVTASFSSLNVTTFSNYNNCGDIQLNWTLPSCYNEVLIVARQGSAVTAAPTGDGTAYTDNTIFGSGTALSAGQFDVYEGTDTSTTITGLTSGNTYYFEIFTRVGTTWSTGVTTSAIASTSSGSGATTFNPGDLVFIGFDSYIGGANDKYSILNLVDIGPNTEFIMANLLYEWNDAAGTSSGKWYDCDNQFDEDPPYALIQYTGCADIPKGSVICIETAGSGNIFSITINGNTATSDFTIDATNFQAGNISTSNPDAIWLMQGTFSAVQTEADGSDNGGALDRYRTFNGTVFGALQTKGNFKNISDNGYPTTPGGDRISRIHPDVECLYIETGPTSNNKFFGFYYGITTGSQYQLLSTITDVVNFWDIQSGTGGVQDSDNVSFTCNDVFSVTSNDAFAGQWMGNISTDWFDCHNWQNFTVPNTTVDVNINTTSTRNCDIDNTSTFAPKYNFVADCNNITLTNRRLIIDSNGDILNVLGDLSIGNTGILDMDDSNASTADGLINLYGNWTNSVSETSFIEGNGTVVFTGNPVDGPQVINSNVPTNTEEFYNVIINNNFDTSTSNNLFANGNLLVNAGYTVTVTDDRYVYVNFDFTNNGTFNIENNGSLVQGSDSGVNTGNISVARSASIKDLDYVYWSSPVTGFNVNNVSPSSPTNRIYKWNPTFANTNGTFGNWIPAAGETMLEGVGYIIRVPNGQAPPPSPGDLNFTATFIDGVPHNGLITPSLTVSHGGNATTDDDDWNLIGNPYPSAIDAYTFLNQTENRNILDGFVNIWTHGNPPSTAIGDPFYYDFGSNYTVADYLTYNGMGMSSGPGNLLIASGQSFMVNVLDAVSTTGNIVFNNSMRNIGYDNSQFYKTSSTQKNNFRNAEKHRIWIDLASENQATIRILVGYALEATDTRDRMFDAISDKQDFYSLIANEKFVIQGRALPFNNDDIIPLGFKSNVPGNLTIAIAAVDGMFENNNQTIYLKDNQNTIIHDLSHSPYSFISASGEFNERFELIFRDASLSTDEFITSSNNLTIIELTDNNVKFSVGQNQTIKSIEIIDLLGRTVYRLKGSSNSETYNLANLSSSAYVAKVTLSNNHVIVKKAIKK